MFWDKIRCHTSKLGLFQRESNVRILVFRNKSPSSKRTVVTQLNMENIHIEILLSKKFQEIGNVLQRKGTERPSTLQKDVDRIKKAFLEAHKKSTRRASLQLGIPQTGGTR
jgi:predicted nucleic acid-binding protein